MRLRATLDHLTIDVKVANHSSLDKQRGTCTRRPAYAEGRCPRQQSVSHSLKAYCSHIAACTT
jgi:hypothetical protein